MVFSVVVFGSSVVVCGSSVVVCGSSVVVGLGGGVGFIVVFSVVVVGS